MTKDKLTFARIDSDAGVFLFCEEKENSYRPLLIAEKRADGTLGTPAFSYIGGKLDVAFIPYPDGWTPTSGLTRDNAEIIYGEATANSLPKQKKSSSKRALMTYGD